MNGLLLAAGLGTRFSPYTDILPKPAIPLMNVPLCFYNLHLIQQLGLDRLTVNTHHLPGEIKNLFKDEKLVGAPITFSDEVGAILGTGGAIRQARESIEGKGTFIVSNADVVNGFGIRDVLEVHHRKQPMATMVVIEHPEAGKKYGAVWADAEDRVVAIGRQKPEVSCAPYHFVGLHLIEESIFKYIPEGFSEVTTHVYIPAIKNGEVVRIHKKEGLWFDAGSLTDYLHATDALFDVLPRLQHQPYFLSLFRRFWPQFDKRPNLWEGENCEHLLTLGAQHKILMGSRCRVHPTSRISGFAVLGSDVLIEKNVEIQNSVIGSGVRVPEGTRLNNTLVLA